MEERMMATIMAGCRPNPRMQPTGRKGAKRRSGGALLERC
jgi:hypothetical protein